MSSLANRWLAVAVALSASFASAAQAQDACIFFGLYDGTGPLVLSGDMTPPCTTAVDCAVGETCDGICVGRTTVLSCSGGCMCPVLGGASATCRDIGTMGGERLCQYPGQSYCTVGGTGSIDEHAVGRCLTTSGSAILVAYAFGDCDRDGVPNGCDANPCDPCVRTSTGGACAILTLPPTPGCPDAGTTATRDAGPSAPDAGAFDAGGASGGDGGGEDAGAAPTLDAGVFDAGEVLSQPANDLVFRGAGGIVCSSTTTSTRGGATSALVGLAITALVASRSRRRARR